MNEVSSRSHAIFTIHITVTFTTKLSHGGGGGENRGVAADGDSEDDVRYVSMSTSTNFMCGSAESGKGAVKRLLTVCVELGINTATSGSRNVHESLNRIETLFGIESSRNRTLQYHSGE